MECRRDTEVDPEGLVGGKEWSQPREGSEEGARPLARDDEFSLEMTHSGEF